MGAQPGWGCGEAAVGGSLAEAEVGGRPGPGAGSRHGGRILVLNCLTIQTCLNSVQVLNNSDNLASC